MPQASGITCTAGECVQSGSVAIPLIPVSSSQLAAVGYDAGTRELVIQFRASGRSQQAIYSYQGVPPELATGLLAAESPGGYFHRHIRQGPFPYRRHQSGDIREDEPRSGEEAPCGCPRS